MIYIYLLVFLLFSLYIGLSIILSIVHYFEQPDNQEELLLISIKKPIGNIKSSLKFGFSLGIIILGLLILFVSIVIGLFYLLFSFL